MEQEHEDVTSTNGTHASAPSPAAGFEVLLITGMSGAGRSHAADSVEDMGWYVVDNMPPKLLVPLVDMMTTAGSGIHKLAAVIDVRSRDYFDDLSAVLSHLDDLGVKTRILFLDASDEVLIKRYESVRRPHPLQQGNRLVDGILEERDLLENLKERADIVIDVQAEHPPAVHQTVRGHGRRRADHSLRARVQFRIQIRHSHRRGFRGGREIPAEPVLGAAIACFDRSGSGRQRLRAFQ